MDRSRTSSRAQRSPTDYTIACFVPLSVELTPLQAMLDDIHDNVPIDHHRNAYVLGELNQHNIVIAQLPAVGNNDSGVVASQLLYDFPSIKFGLLVGIAGGVPGLQGENDVRLGDVVISEPKGTLGGVVQFDRGKSLQGNRLQVTGHLNKPPHFLTATVKKLAAQHQQEGNKIQYFMSEMLSKNPFMASQFKHPGLNCDNLFESDYEHVGGYTCSGCDATRIVHRPVRLNNETMIHYGTIGSSNAVIKNALERDRIGREYGLLSVEMEAAGLMDVLPCLVVRGICDYADSHKNKNWQPYAAAVAAAYTKELLLSIPSSLTSIVAEVPTTGSVQRLARNTKTAVTGSLEEQLGNDAINIFQSLAFSNMDARRWNIREPLPQTCEWLFRHTSFIRWIEGGNTRKHQRFLWFKGKPGSGKSTLMKMAVQWAEESRPSETNVSYFFNARASDDLEKSTLGLYRSITHQLLDSGCSSRELFLKMFHFKARSHTLVSWTLSELTNFLIRSMRATTYDSTAVNIFIDALDEGDDEEVRQLVGFLDDLASAAHSVCRRLRICLSSRHYPHISAKNCLDLIIEDQPEHEDDIGRFVDDKLVGQPSSELHALKIEIRRKAAGIFLWAVLVVPMLNKIHDDGGSVADMALSLQQTPNELSSLFRQLLKRVDDDREECLALFQWMLFSKEPLSPEQLFLGIQASLSRPQANCDKTSLQRLKLYLLSRSRGLTEITKFKPYTVQFIHETVRDFLQVHGLSRIGQYLAGNVVGFCHEKLKVGCEQYISETGLVIMDVRHATYDEFEDYQSRIQKKAPFLKYALSALFWHAEVAASHNIDQHAFMKQYSSKDHTRFQQWLRGYNLLHILSTVWVGIDGHVLCAIVNQGLEKLACVLIESGVDVNAQATIYGEALIVACVRGRKQIAQLLIENGADVNYRSVTRDNPLTTACTANDESIARLLVKSGADVNAEGGIDGSALQAACMKGNERIVSLLIRNGADVNYRHEVGYIPLAIACALNREPIVRLLIEQGADVNVGYEEYVSNPWTVGGKIDPAIVQILQDAGASVETSTGLSKLKTNDTERRVRY